MIVCANIEINSKAVTYTVLVHIMKYSNRAIINDKRELVLRVIICKNYNAIYANMQP